MESNVFNYSKLMNVLNRLTFSFLLIIPLFSVNAQKLNSIEQRVINYQPQIKVDGDLADWGDSLRYRYEKQLLQYEIANDDENVYIAMRVMDSSSQMQALHQGFNLIINKEGKKKEGMEITFPIPDRESLRALATKDSEEKPSDVRKAVLDAARAIYVRGLVDVVDGGISLENSYEIKTAVKIDTNAVSYEAAIPFERLGISTEDHLELAFNVKINGVIMRTVGGGPIPMGRYRGYGYRDPYGYYGNQPTRKEARKESGQWLLLKLAKP